MSAATVKLPDVCPAWCNGEHELRLRDDDPDPSSHWGFGSSHTLDELCNSVTHQVIRPGGAYYDLTLEQVTQPHTMATVITLGANVASARTELPLTSGEARVLARRLLALADRLDLD